MKSRRFQWVLVLAALTMDSPAIAGEKPAPAGQSTGAKRPRVLFIGDSITAGYFPHVKGLVGKRLDVTLIAAEKSQGEVIVATPIALKHLDQWLGNTQWDVIHFNFGLHDLKIINPAHADQENPKRLPVGQGQSWVSVEQYEHNLTKVVQRLKKTDAKLIWATTTPVPDGVVGRVPGNEVPYNEAALRVMKAEGVQVNDLHAFIGTGEQRLKNGGLEKDVHYRNRDPGYLSLAAEVVRAIDSALPSKAVDKP